MSNYENEVDYSGLFWFAVVVTAVGVVWLGSMAYYEAMTAVADRVPGYYWRGIAAGLMVLAGVGWAMLAFNRNKLLDLRKEHEQQTKSFRRYGHVLSELVDQKLVDARLSTLAQNLDAAERRVLELPRNWKPDRAVTEDTQGQEAAFDRDYEDAKHRRLRASQRFHGMADLFSEVGRDLGTGWTIHDRDWYLEREAERVL